MKALSVRFSPDGKVIPTDEALQAALRDYPNTTGAEQYRLAQAKTLIDAVQEQKLRERASTRESEGKPKAKV